MDFLGGADQQGKAAAGADQGGGGGKDRVEALDGAEGDQVEGGGQGFGAGGLYIDVRQCKSAGDFAEEGGLFVVGLDQREREVRGPEFDGKAGESGAGAYVGYRLGGERPCFFLAGHAALKGRSSTWADEARVEVARVEVASVDAPGAYVAGADVGGADDVGGVEVAGGEEALAEVTGDDLFGVADGGQVDAGIPAEEYIDVRRYTLELRGGEDSRFLTGVRRFRMTRARELRSSCSISGRTGVCERRMVRDCDRCAEEGGEQLGDAGGVHRE